MLAAATSRVLFASSVASIWVHQPHELAAAFSRLDEQHPGRFLLGVGVSHAAIVARTAPDRVYARPVSAMNAWLDQMDALPDPIPARRRIVAAIWPRMLALARERALGSHPTSCLLSTRGRLGGSSVPGRCSRRLRQSSSGRTRCAPVGSLERT
jgi:alkanesulfonate monooxygenase SsuD/methylene tetrahydromethanopterin reductase-like flavin-dependent oxidoreductase (luciferase family)